jgi:uncharacterized protein (DUF58 family)
VDVSIRELIDLRRAAQALSLRAGRVQSLQGQPYVSRFKGRGMEFDESRPYQPGDDIRTLDWRVTARTGRAHTKLFREERERPVLLCVDLRPSMFFATRGRFKSKRATEVAALLSWSALAQGDRIGALIFTEQGHWEMRPAAGPKPGLRILEQLAAQARPPMKAASSESADEINAALARLRRVARPGHLVAVVSDFRGLNERGRAHLGQLARHSELILVFLYDVLERELPPPGRYRISNGRHTRWLDTAAPEQRAVHRARFEERLEGLRQLSRRYGLSLIELETRADPLPALQRGLARRLA